MGEMQARLVSLLTTEDRIEIFARGERCATYRYAEGLMPGFVSLAAPGERLITQPNADGLGLWLTHGNVTAEGTGNREQGTAEKTEDRRQKTEEDALSTLNYQLSTPDSSFILHPSSLSLVTDDMTARRGAYSVGFQHDCAWLDGEGARMLTDTRTVRVAPGPSEGVIVDIALQLRTAEDKAVTLGQTEDGLLCLQVASALFESKSEMIGIGQIRNSWGEYGMANLHGRQAQWCAGAGVIRGETIGFAFLEHPDNPFFPSPWIARNGWPLVPFPVRLAQSHAFPRQTSKSPLSYPDLYGLCQSRLGRCAACRFCAGSGVGWLVIDGWWLSYSFAFIRGYS